MAIQSVRRALQVLNLFSATHPRWGISEISRVLDLHKATVQGLVQTLALEGFLEQDKETRKYALGLKVYGLGVALASSLEINQKSAGTANRLAASVEKLVRVAVLEGHKAIITLDAYPRSQPFLFRQFGLDFPLYCTALGKALLAYFSEKELKSYLEQTELVAFTAATIVDKAKLNKELQQIRKDGYSVNRQEHFLGRAAIGSPIHNKEGSVLGSIAIIGTPEAILGSNLKSFANQVVASAAEISHSMGYFPKKPYF